jgi:hypothetical protein
MIKIMYANHYACDNYISNMYQSSKRHRFGENFQNKFSLLQMFYFMLKLLNYMIFFYFHSFMLLTNGKLMKKPWKTFTRLVFMN